MTAVSFYSDLCLHWGMGVFLGLGVFTLYREHHYFVLHTVVIGFLQTVVGRIATVILGVTFVHSEPFLLGIFFKYSASLLICVFKRGWAFF